jgi:hypothetical protein
MTLKLAPLPTQRDSLDLLIATYAELVDLMDEVNDLRYEAGKNRLKEVPTLEVYKQLDKLRILSGFKAQEFKQKLTVHELNYGEDETYLKMIERFTKILEKHQDIMDRFYEWIDGCLDKT